MARTVSAPGRPAVAPSTHAFAANWTNPAVCGRITYEHERSSPAVGLRRDGHSLLIVCRCRFAAKAEVR
jgi:hypothetical protein